jgi:hypothetical protein
LDRFRLTRTRSTTGSGSVFGTRHGHGCPIVPSPLLVRGGGAAASPAPRFAISRRCCCRCCPG